MSLWSSLGAGWTVYQQSQAARDAITAAIARGDSLRGILAFSGATTTPLDDEVTEALIVAAGQIVRVLQAGASEATHGAEAVAPVQISMLIFLTWLMSAFARWVERIYTGRDLA